MYITPGMTGFHINQTEELAKSQLVSLFMNKTRFTPKQCQKSTLNKRQFLSLEYPDPWDWNIYLHESLIFMVFM